MWTQNESRLKTLKKVQEITQMFDLFFDQVFDQILGQGFGEGTEYSTTGPYRKQNIENLKDSKKF